MSGRELPSGYLGLSLEYSALPAYAGTNPNRPDPVFVALVRNLGPGQVLRIGGDSADWTWWPIPGEARPPGVTYNLGSGWVTLARTLHDELGARFILALNLQADDTTVATVEAHRLLSGIGSHAIDAFELGNEPELYGQYPWYRNSQGTGVLGRPDTYSFTDFQADFARFSAALPHETLAGPTTGGVGWFSKLSQFLADQSRVRIVALHRYPLQLCHTSSQAGNYPSVANLLGPEASTGFADSFASVVSVAHGRGLPLRIDELNTVSCGADPAVSQTFAAALWVLDTLFELDRVGVDGVHMHTFPGAGYELFHGGAVSPEYYGLLAFARADPAGSRLAGVASDAPSDVKVWATIGADGRERVVVINKDPNRSHTVRLALTGAHGDATLEFLTAPSVEDHGGVTLGGQSINPATGRLDGPLSTTTVSAHSGRYPVTVPAGSAALLALRR